MKREIKFRAWDDIANVMRSPVYFDGVYWFYIDNSEGTVNCSNVNIKVGSKKGKPPVMQFTGLQDKDGLDIYEGDRAEIMTHDGQKAKGVIEMIDGCWMVCFRDTPQDKRPWVASPGFAAGGLRVGQMYLKMFCAKTIRGSQIKIIGNIHDQGGQSENL